jgi:hypothetical protein
MRLSLSRDSSVESTFHLFHLFLHLHSLTFPNCWTLRLMMMITVSLRSNPVHLQLNGRRLLVSTNRGPRRGVPPILLATPPLLTVRDVLTSTLMTMTTVVQGLSLVLAWPLVLVGLVVATTLIGTRFRMSKRSEFVDFFLLFSPFWCLLPKGEKIRGVNNFLMLCVAIGASCQICWELVLVRWRVRESLKTLICIIMLLCDSICIGYGHVWFVWIRCHLFMLGCLSLYTFVSFVVLELVFLVQSGATVLHS